MTARELRQWAREALRGRWAVSIGVCLLAGILGGGVDLISGSLSTGTTGTLSSYDAVATGAWPMMVTITAISSLAALLIGGAISLGQCVYFINLVSGKNVGVGDLFSRFNILLKALWMNVVVGFFTAMWSLIGILPWLALLTVMIVSQAEGLLILAYLLLVVAVIPGVIASLRYAMVPYIIAEFPEISVMDAVRESKRLMQGNKFCLWCLRLSFIGWVLLTGLSLGIGTLWLTPYMQATDAAFYMDVTGRKNIRYAQPNAE